jgi:hypothetical protein
MSRADCRRAGAEQRSGPAADAPIDSAQIAEEIGITALDLAKRAYDAGLTTLGFLLESVALEAGSEAAARQWPADISEHSTS